MLKTKKYDENLNNLCLYILVGTKHRFRHILREPLQPQGQCYSKLNESLSCYADACYTYTHRVLDHDQNRFRQIQCVRSDGLVVEGKNLCVIKHMLYFIHFTQTKHHSLLVLTFCLFVTPFVLVLITCFVLLYIIKLCSKCLFSIKSNYELRTISS